MTGHWRDRTDRAFSCQKRAATGSRGMVMGHDVVEMATVGGGMNAIEFHDDGTLSGAACWRADGTPIGLSGGLARPGVRFGLR